MEDVNEIMSELRIRLLQKPRPDIHTMFPGRYLRHWDRQPSAINKKLLEIRAVFEWLKDGPLSQRSKLIRFLTPLSYAILVVPEQTAI